MIQKIQLAQSQPAFSSGKSKRKKRAQAQLLKKAT
jgi:hypothetical protein